MKASPYPTVPVRSVRAGVAAAAVVVGMLVACGGSTEGKFGAELYDQSCAGCHGADGSGGTGPALGVGSETIHLDDAQIAGAISVGPGSMPSFDQLDDEQVASLVAYIRELQTP